MSSSNSSPANSPEPDDRKPPENSPVNNPDPAAPRRIVKQNSGKELITGVVIGVAILGFIIYATVSFNEQVAGLKQQGVVIEKTFVPDPEVQITVGSEGVQKEQIPGNYYLKVRMENGSMQTRYVDRVTFARYEVGDSIEWVKTQTSEWERARREVEALEAEQQEGEGTAQSAAPLDAGEAPPEMPLPVEGDEPAGNGSAE